jgi:hypothetical protein
MPDLADLYPGYASDWIDTSAGRIFARSGAKGLPEENPQATAAALLAFFTGR